MIGQVTLARRALRKALTERRQAGVERYDPVCMYDLVEKRGVEIKFQPISSMEGMYIKSKQPVILVSSERPAGRQAYTCAHEYGHHVFGHGSKIDEYLIDEPRTNRSNPEEWLVDSFAGFFLMPKYAVQRAFQIRGWECNLCNPFQIYVVAGHLGVGYETIIQHTRWSLQMLSEENAIRLLRKSPKQIRVSLLGKDSASRLVIVDRFWDKVAVDLQVGEQAILPEGALIENKVIGVIDKHKLGVLIEAHNPGTERSWLPDSTWAVNVRVSRRGYVGRSIFKHLEDPDYEQSDSNPRN